MSSKPEISRLVVYEKGLIRRWCRYQCTANSFAAAVPAATIGLKLPWFASGAKQDAQRTKARMQTQKDGRGEGRRESASMCRGQGGRCSIDGWQLIRRPGTAPNLNGTAGTLPKEAGGRRLCISTPVPKIVGPQLLFLYYNVAVGGFKAFVHSPAVASMVSPELETPRMRSSHDEDELDRVEDNCGPKFGSSWRPAGAK